MMVRMTPSPANRRSCSVDRAQLDGKGVGGKRCGSWAQWRANRYGAKFGGHISKFNLDVKVEGSWLAFEIDSGSPISIINLQDKDRLCPDLEIIPTKRKFAGYNNSKIEILGFVEVSVQVEGRMLRGVNLYVADVPSKQPLMGRDWAKKLKWLDWNKVMRGQLEESKDLIHEVSETKDFVQDLKREYRVLFEKSMGKIKDFQAELKLKEGAQPKFLKPRPPPFAKRDAIERDIDDKVRQGILVKVNQSRWATPVVAIPKASGEVRLCGDYSVTINPDLIIDKHPLPTIEELFADMTGGDKFTKLDLTQAYLQMEVREEDRELLTLYTHKGLYQPTRLMYGVSSAVAIWQRMMENELRDIPGVKVFLDDIRITGPNDEEHRRRLKEVLRRLNEKNMRINFDKCEFFASKIEYCGYTIDKEGIHKNAKKVEALMDMPKPKNKDDVKSLLGFINYYGRFFNNLSTKLHPITRLTKDGVKFKWDEQCENAWDAIREEMCSDDFLTHFDPSKELILAVDASPVGVGACLSHKFSGGEEKPIQYASQTLSDTQQRYSQLDREAYAIIFGIKKFFNYLYGREFTLVTDNKPLSHIFSPEKGIPKYTAMRMQHYAAFLQGFRYKIQCKSSKENGNVDGLSRLPASDAQFETDEPEVIQLHLIETLPVTADEIAKESSKEDHIVDLMERLRDGVRLSTASCFGIDPNEFSIKQGCLIRGWRVYIPKSLRQRVLEELHEGHFGMTKMKMVARGYVWWQGLDHDIEHMVRNCTNCQENRQDPQKDKVHVWEEAKQPFQRVHIDYAGPVAGKYLLVVVDAFSKWPEVRVVSDMTTKTTIRELRYVFATHGFPEVLVSDRGTQFTSAEFSKFCALNGMKHKMGAPFHPSTNGQAERYVRTVKEKLLALKDWDRADLERKICSILMEYRRAPHATTGVSPSQKLYGRQIRSRLDLIVPQEKSGNEVKELTVARSFSVGERVAARNYVEKDVKWKFGVITQKMGKLHYYVKLDDERVWKRHVDQIRKVGNRAGRNSGSSVGNEDDHYWESETIEDENLRTSADTHEDYSQDLQNEPRRDSEGSEISDDSFQDAVSEEGGPSGEDERPLETATSSRPTETVASSPRRSKRTIKAPDRLNL